MSNHYLPSRLPAGAVINYISVLSSLENYRMPTDQNISVEEIINRKIYAWYLQESQHHSVGDDDSGWLNFMD